MNEFEYVENVRELVEITGHPTITADSRTLTRASLVSCRVNSPPNVATSTGGNKNTLQRMRSTIL